MRRALGPRDFGSGSRAAVTMPAGPRTVCPQLRTRRCSAANSHGDLNVLPAQLPPQALSQLLQSFSDLNIETVDTNNDSVADSSVIHFDANNSVTVVGVTGLTAADFHFVA